MTFGRFGVMPPFPPFFLPWGCFLVVMVPSFHPTPLLANFRFILLRVAHPGRFGGNTQSRTLTCTWRAHAHTHTHSPVHSHTLTHTHMHTHIQVHTSVWPTQGRAAATPSPSSASLSLSLRQSRRKGLVSKRRRLHCVGWSCAPKGEGVPHWGCHTGTGQSSKSTALLVLGLHLQPLR